MSYLISESTNGLPSISSSRGLLGDPSIRRSLTRLDDLDSSKHVTFRSTSPRQHQPRSLRSPSPLRSRSPERDISPSRASKTISDLKDQIQVLRDELKRRDEVMSTRSSHNDIHSVDRAVLEGAKSEAAALQVKTEHLITKLRDAQLENEASNARIKELKSTLEQAKENEARQSSLNESLRDRLRQIEASNDSLNTEKTRTQGTVTQLTEEKIQMDEKIRDLEGRLRMYIQDRETAEMKAASWEKRYQESLVILRSALGVDYNESVDTMKLKIQEFVSENTTLKGRLCTLQEALSNNELENKASRETIARLVSDNNKEQSAISDLRREIELLAKEKESSDLRRLEAERANDSLKERLDASQRAWSATKQELEEKTRIFSSLDSELKNYSHRNRDLQSELERFIEQLSCMLSVSPSADLIIDRIRQLQGVSKDDRTMVCALEEKVKSLDDQLRVMYEQKQSAEQNARRCELNSRDLEEKLRHADREISNVDVFRDGLRSDKEKYLRFMERLGEVMKMDRISAEIGYDMNGDALLARAAQLAKLEADALADRNTHIYNLQRKIKTMKEQLESKDLHLDLLRKKIGQLEERIVNRSDLEKERDGETVKVRRLEKTCDKYCKQLEQARMEITDLKAQLLESTKFQVDNQELVSHCEKLETKLGQLDKIRQKQAKKISHLKDEMTISESGGEERMTKAEGAIQALSSELKTTKQLLEDMSQRERQLVDLRTVVARMLGLDVNTLAVPDYEIISRLEKLIQAHHAHTLTNWSLDHTLENMEDGLRTGYTDAKIYLGEPRMHEKKQHIRSSSNERESRSPRRQGRSPERRRHRSTSPTKVDSRKY